jgi:putative nucleotidyltransferase with HDIG domain
MLPTVTQCYELMDRYEMLDNIKEHSIVVARVARMIARALVHAGVRSISEEKAVAGALLHDIGKTICLKNGGDHAAVGRQICLRHHFDDVAEIVGQHVWLGGFSAVAAYREEELVYYADKRVNHTCIVSLEERLHYVLGRYGSNHHRCRLIRGNFLLCQAVEQKLFARLSFPPEAVAGMIATSRDPWP